MEKTEILRESAYMDKAKEIILITGGAFQGKSDFARRLRKDLPERETGESSQEKFRNCQMQQEETGAGTEMQVSGEGWILQEDLHLLIAKALKEKRDPNQEIEQLLEAHPRIILTVNELGCGIVPIDAFDREWREVTGRICCRLAGEAAAVYRVTCGIAVRLK